MTAPRTQIDVVRLDTLLWALGGFAEPDEDSPHAQALPESLWRKIDGLAAMPRTPHGALRDLAATSGRSYGSLGVLIHRARRHGYRPWYRLHDSGPPPTQPHAAEVPAAWDRLHAVGDRA